MITGRVLRAMVLAVASACVVASASGAVGARPSPAGPPSADAATSPTGNPTMVEPISAISVAVDQVAATDACLITDSTGQHVASFGFKGIKGAARITPARDLPRYVPLWGTEPEIQTDDPAWVFWFEGVVTIPIDITERDPVCVVVHGEPSWFSVGASYLDGEWVAAKPPPGGGPTEVLPAVMP